MYVVHWEETTDAWLSRFPRTHCRPCFPHQRHRAPEDPTEPGRGSSRAARTASPAGLSPCPGTAGRSRSLCVPPTAGALPGARSPPRSLALPATRPSALSVSTPRRRGGRCGQGPGGLTSTAGRGRGTFPPGGSRAAAGGSSRCLRAVPGSLPAASEHGGPGRAVVGRTPVGPWSTCARSSENRNNHRTRTLPVTPCGHPRATDAEGRRGA